MSNLINISIYYFPIQYNFQYILVQFVFLRGWQKGNENSIQLLGSCSANALKVITEIYKQPIINAAKVAKISLASAYTLISELEKLNILIEVSGGKRAKVYILKKYIDIFDN